MKNILVLPGLLEDLAIFADPVEALASRATFQSADLTGSDSIAALAASALEGAPPGPLCLLAHSMGGYVALEILRQAPQRIERVAFFNTHARPDTPEATENRRRLVALAERDFPAVITTLLPKLMLPTHVDELSGRVTEMALAVGKDAFARQERAIIGRIDSRPHLGRIRCPALVVAGREDQLMPVDLLRELAQGIPGARLEIIDECGHLAPLEQPAKTIELLGSWLEA